MANETTATTDHDQIRNWAEKHDAVPASVRDTADADPGVLTLDVQGYGADEEDLEHLEWDAWFAKFDDSQLAFLYQEEKASGEDSTFFKLVDRASVDV